MSQGARGPAASSGPILLSVIGPEPEEAAIRHAFAEADERGVALFVVVTAAAPAGEDGPVAELIERWSEKYPGVAVTTGIRRGIDAVATASAQGGSTATGQAVRPMRARIVSPSCSSPVAGPLRAAITTSETSPLSAIKAWTTSRSCRISRSVASASAGVRWS